jgi:hypothetical protein
LRAVFDDIQAYLYVWSPISGIMEDGNGVDWRVGKVEISLRKIRKNPRLVEGQLQFTKVDIHERFSPPLPLFGTKARCYGQ